MIAWLLLFATFAGELNAATNLLHNADFESSNFNGNWYAIGCHMTQSNDAYHGHHSAHLSNRDQNWNGLAQNINLNAGSRYKTTAYVKLLNTANNKAYQSVTMMLNCKDGSGKDIYKHFGTTQNVQPGQWCEIGGVLHTSNGYHSCHIYVQTDAHTDYLVDSASMELVPYDSNWKSHANQRIEQYRKADINIKLTGTSVDTSSVDIELKQTKMEFAFGSAVSATNIVDHNHAAYQKTFYDNFEWGVLENALKWRQMEWSKGHINYDRPLNAIKAMRSHGIKMRCHCAFWDKDDYTQDWVKALHGDALRSAIHTRIQGVTSHTKGMCEQWDVNNEMLHGGTYERLSGDPNITMDMFRQMHTADRHPLLFLNEYSVISNSQSAVAHKDTAMRYKKAGVPVGGLGVQGHMHNIDIHVIKAQLDILAEAGLPIMITELGVNDKDENSRASKLVNLLTLFFSHPSVKGVLLWGFWDGQIWEKDAPLFTGTNLTPNAAGRAYQNLFHNQWRTSVTHTIHGHEQYHVRGFKGEYTLNVKHNGHILKTETFTLSDGGKTLQVHLNGNTGGTPSVSHVIVG
ncbi:anti-sigma-I factor RsgI6-like [Mercenaria mercenaria]|uniref:anti-sigma-I factor RsgI6-like n=1 Tax=Mercenaria mercenaria TaxID=6596 RepID=UPI00234E4792|nr:anti-sigma-I factor RsgI6-like [Mercenaria mercenaria]